MKKIITVLIVLSIFLEDCFSQSQRDLYNNSIKAYEAKNYSEFLQLTKQLDSIRPMHPTFTYNLAIAYALQQQTDKAVLQLKKVILMNAKTSFEDDADFQSIKETEAFKSLSAFKQKQLDVVATSQKAITLSEKALHPESVLYLSKTKTWLASSIRKRKIVSFDEKTGKCSDWLTAENILAVFALKPDAKEEFLWVATSAIPEMENYSEIVKGKAEILKVNIKTKKIVNRYSLEGNHVFGDIYVTKNNKVFISDSDKPIIYTIENDALAVWLSLENTAFNLQGITMNTEEDKLFVADYLKGIAVVKTADKEVNWLHFPKDATSKGIDGLVYYKNSLFAVQNGVSPIRITQLKLNSSHTEITDFKVVDNNRPEFDEPALLTLVKDKLYFFANSPWKAYDKNGVLDESKVTNPELYFLKL
ncbi:MAG: tetratricopeptide repeat protein [Flavobacterium sp.]